MTRNERIDRWAVLLATFGLICAYVMLGSMVLKSAYRHDFLNLYTGGALAFDAQIYDIHRQADVEQQLVPDPARPLIPFVRPVWYAWVLHPLSWVPYPAAFPTWIAIQCALLAWCWWRIWKRFGDQGLLLAALFLPTQLGIAHGQDCTLMLLLVLEAYLAAERNRWTRAGILLALALMKWHLLLLMPLTLLVQRRWRAFAGWTATAAALLILFAASGTLPSYVALLQHKDLERLSPSENMMLNLRALSINFNLPWLWIPLAVGVVVVVIRMRGAPLWQWFGVAVAGSLLVPPHVYGYDAAVLLVPVLAAVSEARSKLTRLLAFTAALPFAYEATLLPAPWSAIPAALLLSLFVAISSDGICGASLRQLTPSVSRS